MTMPLDPTSMPIQSQPMSSGLPPPTKPPKDADRTEPEPSPQAVTIDEDDGLAPDHRAPQEQRWSFEDVFRDEYRKVVGLVMVIIGGDRAAAEDIAEDAFLAALERWAMIGNYQKPGAWIRKIALQRAFRSQKRAKGLWKKLTSILPTDHLEDSNEPCATRVDIVHAIGRLPRRQQEVMVLRAYGEYSIAEIAQFLNIKEGTVKKHLHDARAKLAKETGDELDGAAP